MSCAHSTVPEGSRLPGPIEGPEQGGAGWDMRGDHGAVLCQGEWHTELELSFQTKQICLLCVHVGKSQVR